MTALSLDEGRAAVRWARAAVQAAVEGRGAPPADAAPRGTVFAERRGAFVTLRSHPDSALRGCIGLPYPVRRLDAAIAEAAASAALEDPRFVPVRPAELIRLTVELSVLTEPRSLADRPPARWPEAIGVGRDGLLVEAGKTSGLLLPQVAVEMGWDARQFLDGVCEKAGLPPSAWVRPGVRLWTFQADVFEEPTPGAPAVRRELLPPPVHPGATGPPRNR